MLKFLSPFLLVALLVSVLGCAAQPQTPGAYVDDSWITTKVKSEFATKSGVDATDISVTTKDGSVMLSGHVANEAEKMKAKQVAASVKGVKSVDTSGLTITASGE